MPGTEPASTPGGQYHEYLQRAYALKSVDEAKDLYNEWAKDYDGDLSKHDYASPQAAVDTFIKLWPGDAGISNENITILDAGCGTGLVGECLVQSLQAKHQLLVDGVDLTPGMLDAARQKAIYRHLYPADLNEKLSFHDNTYDVVFCVGTLTKGHVGPKCFAEFARIAKPGGLVIATVHDEIWERHGYKSEVNELGRTEIVEVVSTDPFGIFKGKSDGGIIVVLRRK